MNLIESIITFSILFILAILGYTTFFGDIEFSSLSLIIKVPFYAAVTIFILVGANATMQEFVNWSPPSKKKKPGPLDKSNVIKKKKTKKRKQNK